ncbi:nitroreductase family protein [Desulfosarcina sp. OttesenSCG-928-A07]|nr:nitroreductase family protein [Desulfosarcina sp. OttesenSCG-928-G17]MDL2328601.1 nitroreductase family protein [Desulfosarcina sp. OttesenSCG-928-A07]
MAFLRVDTQKCRQDGLCAMDCPAGIILFDGPGHYPELKPRGEKGCLRCGHCVAICPHGAMDHAEVRLSESPAIDPALSVSPVQAEQFLRSRRSVRRFKSRPVDRADLQQLIEIARYAPTAANVQLLKWRVIDDQNQIRSIAAKVVDWIRQWLENDKASAPPYMDRTVKNWENGVDSIFHSAPGLVVAMAPAMARNGLVDLTLALSYLELAAPGFGLGTCWAGMLQGALKALPSLRTDLGILPDYPFYYTLMIGYSAVKYHRLPQRKPPEILWG